MISKEDLGILIGREGNPGHPVLSVYLNVDQSRETNLNRKFEVSLGNLLRELEQGLIDGFEREVFAASAERMRRFVADYQPAARNLVILCDALGDFLWHRELNVPLRNEVRWSEAFYLRPLIEALDEFERYGVVLADRAQARLFTVYLGEIEEHGESFAPGEVKISKAAGTDHVRSQMRFQRKADQYAHRHLKRVAELTVELADRHSFDRLLLAGPVEATSQLHHLLPKQWQSRVVASLNLPVDAAQHSVLAATLRFSEEAERDGEIRSVAGLISDAAPGPSSGQSLDSTLRSEPCASGASGSSSTLTGSRRPAASASIARRCLRRSWSHALTVAWSHGRLTIWSNRQRNAWS